MDNQTSSIYYNGNRSSPGLPNMAKPFLDCTAEVTGVRAVPKNRWAWLAADILEEHWRLELDDDVLDEMHGLAAFILMNPHQEHQRRADEFRLTKCRRLILKMKNILDDGAGFAVLNRLPMDDYPLDAMVEVYWLLGQLVGRPVAQNWIGQVIYDVHDSGATYQYGVRGSHTTVELTLRFALGSHKLKDDYKGIDFFTNKGMRDQRDPNPPDWDTEPNGLEVASAPMKAGDCAILNFRTHHSAPGNPQKNRRRRVICTHWFGDDARYVDKKWECNPNERGEGLVDRGRLECSVFPRVF